ncbi:developmentally-regulated GTP-binding protein 2-like [Saccoglossus kowalevskii]|uniref:Developmentally-regulated GTP-binding protein 2-like n=1 Tax=Saccoglossus kowalevskii TaxID=10224 RepID=A0ABM0M9C6_SACKO|nr:PREDICTED: developmentally-regulated GTP-binding protein 2-like [Saccoglossus kowalevskii]
MGILDKISEIEKEIARTQKNKATEYHLGLLKAKLARYRQQLLEPQGKSGPKHKGANIQLLDLPGIIEGASQGKGRGRQVIAVARTADLVVMMLDAGKGDVQKVLLEKELESVGLRLNKDRPNIYFKQKKGGGVSFNSTLTLTKCSEKMVQLILHEYKIFNAEVLFREDCTAEEFIDVVVGKRVYLPCIYVYNKVDQISIEEVDRIAHQPHCIVTSCEMKLNLDYFIDVVWEYLALIRVYTKKRSEFPDLEGGLILRKGCTVEHVCHAIHRTMVNTFKYALVYGTSVKYSPQRVGLHHIMHDEDVIQIINK